MHREFLKNLSRIKPKQLGVLKNCTAVLGKSESGSIYRLFSNQLNNWWWRSISQKELTPDYFAVVLFFSHIDMGTRVSLKTYQTMIQSKLDGTKTPISSTISGIMIGNIVFVKDAYDDQSYEFNFEINTENNVMIKSTGAISDDICFRGVFDLKTCPFYCPISN